MSSTIAPIVSGYRPLIAALVLAAVSSAGCSKGEPTKDQLLARAKDALAAEQYVKAERDYREVLRLAPEDSVALLQLALIYHDQGQILQAYPLLKKFAELQPDDLEAQLKLGLTSLAIGDYKQARDAAIQIVAKQPENEQALLLVVDTAVEPEQVEESRKLIENLREKHGDRSGYHLALGALDLRQKNDVNAESEFNAALEMDPKSSKTYAALGTLHWSRNDLKATEQAFKTAADLSPLRSPMRLRYVDFKLRTGATAEAKEILDDINRKAPDYLPPRVYLMKIACSEHRDDNCASLVQNILAQDTVNYDAVFEDGVLSLSKGDAAKAIRDFEYLSNVYRQNPQVRYQLALAYLLSARGASAVESRSALDNAESRLNEAVALNPRFEQAVRLFAELKIRKGSAAAAIDPLVTLIKERPQLAQAHYLLATAYLAQQQSYQALAVYRKMMELFPQDAQPSFLIGTILLAQRQLPQARQAFERAASIAPDYLPAIGRLVDLDIAGAQFAAAIDRVKKQIDKDPKLAQPWALRARVYFAQRDFTRAEADLLKAIELDPKPEAPYLLLAQLYVDSNRQQEAIEKLNAYVAQNRNVPALMQLAMIHERLKQFAAARDAYEKLLTVAANFAPALNNLAVLYSEQLGQPDKAYDLAKQAREVNPNEPSAADTLGWILFKKGDYAGALRLMLESAGKLPDRPEISFHLGMAHYMLGEEGPARIALQKAVAASADFSGKDEARQRLALLTIDAATANTGARNELDKYLQTWPNDPAALARLAQLQEREGKVDEASKSYEKVVADYPLFSPAIRGLALLYARSSADVAKAYEITMNARQAYPDDPEIAKALGIQSYRRELYPRSAELLREAAAKRQEDGELFFYLGAAHHQLKQWNECKVALERAISLELTARLADDAPRTLAECTEMVPE